MAARLVGLAVLAGLGLLSCWWSVADLISLRRAAASRGWPTVQGEVQRVGTHRRTIEMTDRDVTCFEPCVLYAYQVNGVRYTACRVILQPSNELGESTCHPMDHVFERAGRRCFCSRSEAWRIAAGYKAGQKVDVRYDPDDPAEACLRPYDGDHSLTWAVLKLLSRLALLGALALVLLHRNRAAAPKGE